MALRSVLQASEKTCTACSFHETCVYTNKMEGNGSEQPVYLFVGQNPGRNEDRIGKPFQGKAGKLLVDILKELGFKGKNTRFTNATRCWAGPGDPAPEPKHIKACKPYLLEEIEKYKPKVVVLLGNTALKSITGKDGITKQRGRAWEEDGIYYAPAVHPAAILRNPTYEKKFREDMQQVLHIAKYGITASIEVEKEVVYDFDLAMDYFKYMALIEEILSFDIETNTNEPWTPYAEIVMSGYCWEDDHGISIPIFKPDAGFTEKQQRALLRAMAAMHRKRRQRGLPCEAYNASFDLMFPKVAYNIPLMHLVFDAYLGNHLLEEHIPMPSLKQLAWDVGQGGYETEMMEYVATHPECNPKKGGTYKNVPVEILGPYNAMDAVVERLLRLKMTPKLEEQNLMQTLEKVTIPGTYAVLNMVSNGIHLDMEFLDKLRYDYPNQMNKMLADMNSLPAVKKYVARKDKEALDEWKAVDDQRRAEGKTRSLKKPKPFTYRCTDKQNRELFFEDLGLHSDKETKGGVLSVDSSVREMLRDKHPVVRMVDDYKHFIKFNGYVKRFVSKSDEHGIYHPFYDLTGTVTGRCTSDLQQLPRVTTNADIRKLITSRFGEDGLVMEADYDQHELRVWTIVSKDKALRDIYNSGRDAHSMAACQVYKVDYDDFMAKYVAGNKDVYDKRTRMKSAISFGLTFGREAPALAEDMGWTIEEAQEFIDNYFSIFSGVKKKINYYRRFVRKHGYVVNMFGRRRRLPEAVLNTDTPSNAEYRAMFRALRQAVNFPIQSTAHDMMLVAQHRVWKTFTDQNLRSLMLGEVHDSLILDVYKPELKRVARIVKNRFENLNFKWIDIPLKADIKVGPNLGELKTYNV